ncbi:hypothetical protein BH23CHL1_BH23CHL1_20450 [soil metagenome]
MIHATMKRIVANGVELEIDVQGSGDPVVLIQTALLADEFLPVASEPVLRKHYQVILYHRRGYAGRAPVQGAMSIRRDAHDCRALLAALSIGRAHVSGCRTVALSPYS